MAKTLAIVFGIVFVLVGILGWVPNPIVGMNGIFMTNHLHDIVHLVTGIVLLVVAFMAADKSGLWLKIAGVVYLLVAVLGFLMAPNGGDVLGVSMNMTDHLLHVVLGIVLIVAGFAGAGGKKMASAPSMPSAPAAPSSSSNTPMGGSM